MAKKINTEEQNKKDAEELMLKEVSYYEAMANAWFTTKMERDKSLLILSTSAVGLLITLLTAFGINHYYDLIFYVLAILSFLVSIITAIDVFSKNADYLRGLIKGQTVDLNLKVLDERLKTFFYIGIALSLLIAINVSVVQLNKEQTMSKDQKVQYTSSEDKKKSFDGAADLKPKPASPKENTSSSGKDTSKTDGKK